MVLPTTPSGIITARSEVRPSSAPLPMKMALEFSPGLEAMTSGRDRLEGELVLELQQCAQPQRFRPLFGKLLDLGLRRYKLGVEFLIFLLSAQKAAISPPGPKGDIRYPAHAPVFAEAVPTRGSETHHYPGSLTEAGAERSPTSNAGFSDWHPAQRTATLSGTDETARFPLRHSRSDRQPDRQGYGNVRESVAVCKFRNV